MIKTKSLRKFGDLERDVLAQLSASDMLIGMLLSSRNTKTMYAVARARAARRQAMQRAIYRLKSQGLVEIDDGTLHLTQKGRNALEFTIAGMRKDVHDGRQNWDGHWRLVAFDIPESKRRARDALRFILKRAGFCQLQQSMWVYPYDCKELQELLDEDTRLKRHVVYAKVSWLSDEAQLLRHFKLVRKIAHV